ncbi:MAG: substrate-binding domain-containing protein [Caldilineaceae bacterium]
MRRTRLFTLFSILAVLAMVLAACPGGSAPAPSEEAATAAPAAEAKVYKIGFSIPGLAFPFFVHMAKQVQDEGAKLGVEIIVLDGQDNTEKQAADLESVIAQGLDGLIVSPRTTEGLVEVIQGVVDAGIPVVTVDRRAEGVTGLLAHVGAENVLGGEAQGQALLELFPNGATIFELQGTPGASPAIDRGQGLHNIIDPAGNFTIPCQQTGNFNRADGLKVTESCLGATPNPDAIVAANDDMALGAAEAVKAAGLSIPIIAYDALPEAIKAIQDGSLYGSVEQFPGEQTRTSLRTLMDFITAGTKPAQEVIFITPKLITADNLGEAERAAEAGVEAAAPAPAAAASGDPLQIAFSIPGLNFPFFVHMAKQVQDEGAKLGVEIIVLDGQDNTEKQAADLESVIVNEYDGLIVSPRTTEGLVEVIQAVVDAGIPVVTVDRRAEGVTGLLAHVGAENVLGGEAQGQALLELFPDGGVIFELQGTPGASPAIDRGQGLHNIIDPAGNFEIPCQQTGNFNRADGLKVTESCLGATPNPDAIVAANDDMALGAAEAVKAAGLSIPIIAYDALPEAIKAIQDDLLYGSVEQFPGEQTRTSLRTLLDFINNGTTPESDVIFITPKMITADNIEEAERISEVQ